MNNQEPLTTINFCRIDDGHLTTYIFDKDMSQNKLADMMEEAYTRGYNAGKTDGREEAKKTFLKDIENWVNGENR